MPFSSKGYGRAATSLERRTVDRLWEWTDHGRLPVVVDASPCAWTLRQVGTELDGSARRRSERLRILDGVEFAVELLDNGLVPRRRQRSVMLHPVCSIHKMELVPALERVARACAERVDVPLAAGCCGFAGDRGLLFPELTAAALAAEAAEVRHAEVDGCYSTSRTCEIGLTRATGRSFRSIWTLLDETTR